MPRASKKSDETVVQYGGVTVRMYAREDGRYALNWRENGKIQKTTLKNLEVATKFANEKARAIEAATGQRWISPARQERLDWLERLAGGEALTSALLHQLEAALRVLGSVEELATAARYYQSHGPASVKHITLHQAAEIIIGEYPADAVTMKGMRTELRGLTRKQPKLLLLDATHELMDSHIRQPHLSKRSVKNKLTIWTTFFRRCIALGYWPKKRDIPTVAIKRDRKDDKTPEIFTIEQATTILALVLEKMPQHLSYLLIAGWLGCRPSECLRLRWVDFDFEQRLLHVRVEVAKKTASERWVPFSAELSQIFQTIRSRETHASFLARGTVCRKNAREDISRAVRKIGIEWPADVLRHSFITYRLQVTSNIVQTADEAGNSPNIIRSNYRRPIKPGIGEKWFALADAISI